MAKKLYKVGDLVTIKSKHWYNRRKGLGGAFIVYDAFVNGNTYFTEEMAFYCNKLAKITEKHGKTYKIDIDDGEFIWVANMFNPVNKKFLAKHHIYISKKEGKEGRLFIWVERIALADTDPEETGICLWHEMYIKRFLRWHYLTFHGKFFWERISEFERYK